MLHKDTCNIPLAYVSNSFYSMHEAGSPYIHAHFMLQGFLHLCRNVFSFSSRFEMKRVQTLAFTPSLVIRKCGHNGMEIWI